MYHIYIYAPVHEIDMLTMDGYTIEIILGPMVDKDAELR